MSTKLRMCFYVIGAAAVCTGLLMLAMPVTMTMPDQRTIACGAVLEPVPRDGCAGELENRRADGLAISVFGLLLGGLVPLSGRPRPDPAS